MPFNANIAIICAVSLAAFVFLGIFILIFAKMLKGNRREKRKNGQEPEARLIQEIYQGLTRMEQRVEALETILFDHKKERIQDDQ